MVRKVLDVCGNESCGLSAIIAVWMPKIRVSQGSTNTRNSGSTGSRPSKPPSVCWSFMSFSFARSVRFGPRRNTCRQEVGEHLRDDAESCTDQHGESGNQRRMGDPHVGDSVTCRGNGPYHRGEAEDGCRWKTKPGRCGNQDHETASRADADGSKYR